MATTKPSLIKTEIAKELAKKWGGTQGAAQAMFEDVLEVLAEGLAKGERVYLDDFGSLTPQRKEASVKYIPSQGKKITVPAHTTVKFKMFGPLEARLNKQGN